MGELVTTWWIKVPASDIQILADNVTEIFTNYGRITDDVFLAFINEDKIVCNLIGLPNYIHLTDIDFRNILQSMQPPVNPVHITHSHTKHLCLDNFFVAFSDKIAAVNLHNKQGIIIKNKPCFM